MAAGKIPFSSSLLLLLLLSAGDPFRNAAVSASEIFTSSSGVRFGRSSREPKYKIDVHPANSPFHPDSGQESVVITNKDGRSYTCFLPIVEEPKTVNSVMQQNSSSIIIEADRRIKFKTPDELLDALKERCFYRHEGWWSYEFCYRKHLRQLHVEDDKLIYVLFYGPAGDLDVLQFFIHLNNTPQQRRQPSSFGATPTSGLLNKTDPDCRVMDTLVKMHSSFSSSSIFI